MDKYKHLMIERGQAVGVSNKAIEQLKKVQTKIERERRQCEEDIAKMELHIESAKKQIDEKRNSIQFLSEEAVRTEKTVSRLSDLIVTQ